MAPFTNVPLSPAELSYLRTSISHVPPIRPDGRSPIQFRPLVAETDILPSANGSARICFSDGTEAIVGVKAEVENIRTSQHGSEGSRSEVATVDAEVEDGNGDNQASSKASQGRDEWVQVAIEVPGLRDDDALPVFLAAMLTEALLADGELKNQLWINTRFHWRLYIDILLLSQPLSYPLPLLSLTVHLAMLSTRIPALVSEKDEDPLFNDDWEASTFLYPRTKTSSIQRKPPVTLLVMSVGDNILFDPSHDELAVADSVLAISAAQTSSGRLQMVALRTIDPPSRLTAAGVPDILNTTNTGGVASMSQAEALALREKDQGQTVWRPPRGGARRGLVAQMIKMVVQQGGIGEEVMDGLAGVDA